MWITAPIHQIWLRYNFRGRCRTLFRRLLVLLPAALFLRDRRKINETFEEDDDEDDEQVPSKSRTRATRNRHRPRQHSMPDLEPIVSQSEKGHVAFQHKNCDLEPAFPDGTQYPHGWLVYHPRLGVVTKEEADSYEERKGVLIEGSVNHVHNKGDTTYEIQDALFIVEDTTNSSSKDDMCIGDCQKKIDMANSCKEKPQIELDGNLFSCYDEDSEQRVLANGTDSTKTQPITTAS